jgi:type VI secretion system protein ImpL
MAIRAAAFAAVALLTLVGAGLLWRSHANSQAQIAESEAALAAYVAAAQQVKLNPVTDADLPAVIQMLEQARLMPHGFELGKDLGSSWGIGLSQLDKISIGEKGLYRHTLERVLLPRLIWRLEAQMRGNFNRPDFLYEATRVYLMLGSAGPLDRALVSEWMQADWNFSYPGAGAQPFREALVRHLDALLDNPLPRVELDGGMVEDARRTFSRVTLAERVYSRIKPIASTQQIAPWRPADAAGASGVRVFIRGSGKPLSEGIPGLYTVEGFHRAVLPNLSRAAKEVASESWVLGTRSELDPRSPQMVNLERDVVKLYTDDYAKQWDAMLADLNVVPLRSMSQAVQDLYVLSSPQSPMRDLLAGIAKQLTLSVAPPLPPGVAGAVQGATAAVGAAAASAQAAAASRVAGLMGQTAGPPPEPPGKAIDDRYKPLRDFVGSGPGAPIDLVLKLMNDLQQQLNKLASAPAGGAPPLGVGDDPARLLQTEASRQPQPVARWLQAMAVGGSTLRGGGARQAAAAAFAGPGGPAQLCQQAVEGRYPFFRGAVNEIPMDDFGRLFAPGGLLDSFFNTQVRPFVDMSTRTWTAKDVDGVPPPVTPADLAQFQRAAVIRDLFFAGGGAAPTVRFDVTPTSLDAGARQVTLDLDGLVVSYAHGPSRATQITWPGPTRMNNVRLVLEPAPAGGTGVLQDTGPWSLFRLFGKGTLTQAGGAEKYTLGFQLGERLAVFEIRAGSVLNPFAPGVLQDFRCPTLK